MSRARFSLGPTPSDISPKRPSLKKKLQPRLGQEKQESPAKDLQATGAGDQEKQASDDENLSEFEGLTRQQLEIMYNAALQDRENAIAELSDLLLKEMTSAKAE